jgi:hypothetical protein
MKPYVCVVCGHEQDECEAGGCDKWNDAYFSYLDEVLEPYTNHIELTHLAAYQMFGACHTWNSTFGITLARILIPNEEWVVITTPNHTTVANKQRTRFFDILWETGAEILTELNSNPHSERIVTAETTVQELHDQREALAKEWGIPCK